MDWPNGEPGSSPAGASAVARSPQHVHRPPNRPPGHVGADRRQLNTVVDLLRGLRRFREHRSARWARGQLPVELTVRVWMQSPACPGAALAGWTIRPDGWRVLLLALGWGLGTVVRGFRRPGQFVDPRLKRRAPRVLGGDTCLGGGQLLKERSDQRIFLGMAQSGQVGCSGHPAVGVESPVTVSSGNWRGSRGAAGPRIQVHAF